MNKLINNFCEILAPILIGIILYWIIELETVKSLLDDDNKISLLVNTYSILIGFIVTSMAIFMTSSSKALVNISKNNKTLRLVIYFFITLISSLLFVGMCIISTNLKIFKLVMIISASSIVQYMFVTLNIFYQTLNSMYDEKIENDKYKEKVFKKLDEIGEKLKAIYSKN
ncbi:hypothetical protein H5J22_02380 [Cetobacterium sp. 8H]|uniref:hypothetical protein n=1 Tax=Cetobacterium sp. 8H TaxID=2759681 RepID=UPI00163C0ED8|nr:hypothetical protein [Cetobacterium sp. 8H]MBC2850289.1 hypothetical protein [Cetobacterium sp. 8H]